MGRGNGDDVPSWNAYVTFCTNSRLALFVTNVLHNAMKLEATELTNMRSLHRRRIRQTQQPCILALQTCSLSNTLVVQVQQLSGVCVCVSLEISFRINDRWPTYLARWLNLTLSIESSKVKVAGQSSRSQVKKNVLKVVGATSSEGFLVFFHPTNHEINGSIRMLRAWNTYWFKHSTQ